MLKALLILSGISALLYCIAAFTGWMRRKRSDLVHPPHSYFWGLMFALLFYYGFPFWWWRYGLRKTLELIITCALAVVAIQTILRVTGLIKVDNLGESLAAGLLIAVPVRAIGGLWVARRDAEWRSKFLQSRKKQLVAS